MYFLLLLTLNNNGMMTKIYEDNEQFNNVNGKNVVGMIVGLKILINYFLPLL